MFLYTTFLPCERVRNLFLVTVSKALPFDLKLHCKCTKGINYNLSEVYTSV